jgi:hypothetical protein
MGRTICSGVLALLVSNTAVFAQTHVAPRRPVKVIVVEQQFHPRCFLPLVVPTPVFYPVPYATTQYSAPNFIPASPTYLLVGSASPTRPQLVFKDLTSYTVSDYWRVDHQLHFITLEEGGTKSVPHSVAFDSLDLQQTKDAAEAQGFRFVIRDEPLQQWLEHRAQHEHGRTGTSEKS